MAKTKIAGLPLSDAMTVFNGIQESQKALRTAQEKLAAAFNSINMCANSSLDDPWTLRTICEELTANESEKLILFEHAMKENPFAAVTLLKYRYYNPNDQDVETNIALNTLMDKPDEIFKLIENNKKFDKARLDKLWELYGKYWFKKYNTAPVKLELLCRIFRDNVTYDHLALMVKRYVGRKMDTHARRLQKDEYMNLPPDLVDQLEGCIMMKALMKSNK